MEVYDFSPSVKTVNIRRLLAKFEDTAYRIKWVDETHTLVVFRDSALGMQLSFYLTLAYTQSQRKTH